MNFRTKNDQREYKYSNFYRFKMNFLAKILGFGAKIKFGEKLRFFEQCASEQANERSFGGHFASLRWFFQSPLVHKMHTNNDDRDFWSVIFEIVIFLLFNFSSVLNYVVMWDVCKNDGAFHVHSCSTCLQLANYILKKPFSIFNKTLKHSFCGYRLTLLKILLLTDLTHFVPP